MTILRENDPLSYSQLAPKDQPCWTLSMGLFDSFKNFWFLSPKWLLVTFTGTKNNRAHLLTMADLYTKFKLSSTFPCWVIVYPCKCYWYAHTHPHTHVNLSRYIGFFQKQGNKAKFSVFGIYDANMATMSPPLSLHNANLARMLTYSIPNQKERMGGLTWLYGWAKPKHGHVSPPVSGWEEEVPSHPHDLNSSLSLHSQSGRGSTLA